MFRSTSHRAGADRYIADRPAETSLENERDLGLAIRARDHQLAKLRAAMCAGDGVHPAASRCYEILKSIVWGLQGNRYWRASPKQRALCMQVLGLETLPPIASNVPAACRVLPLKPPGR